ncbi:hypothetical protein [Sabulicella glaciei]|uniref:Lipoprotein n=1 Tax=Sabulicella glaciei TaxID=2984948 RepID=A0ABT3NWY6_9PROT|nr:hypothetical protein [Roseococcus sp. MDT2-1-1]MCW8086688.1 hypothetical protein [Roseococcus sp. MDT2-1-1]
MRAASLLLAALALSGCGRYGPPRPPGPPEAVAFPRSYPAPTPAERAREIERYRAAGQPVPDHLLR